MSKYVISSQAEKDLEEIRDCIARDDKRAADRVYDAIEEGMRKIARMPGAFPVPSQTGGVFVL